VVGPEGFWTVFRPFGLFADADVFSNLSTRSSNQQTKQYEIFDSDKLLLPALVHRQFQRVLKKGKAIGLKLQRSEGVR
jgi:hypothetical protein